MPPGSAAPARALPETFDGVLSSAHLARYLTTRTTGAEPEHEVDDTTLRHLLAAGDDGTLTIEPFTTATTTIETNKWRRRLSFIARTFLVGGTKITIYQVRLITHQQPDEAGSAPYSEQTLYLNH
ncbi:hypothetical protein ACFQ7I_08790 [Streptomyces massasporeus]